MSACPNQFHLMVETPQPNLVAEEARITCAIVDAAAKVRDLNSKYLAAGKGATEKVLAQRA